MNEKLSASTIFEGMIEVLSRRYSYLAVKQDEFDQVKSFLGNKAGKVNDYNEIMVAALEALSCLKDCHIRVINGEGKFKLAYPVTKLPRNYDHNITERYLSDVQKSGPITLGRVGDVIYVGIDSLVEDYRNHFEWLSHIGRPSERKFIIDLRANEGGHDRLAQPGVSFLLGDMGPIISSYFRYRMDEKDPTKLTGFRPRYVMPDHSSFRRDVVVLTSSQTCSSAELITMDLAAIPGTILVGDVTSGSSGCPHRYLVDGPNRGKIIDYSQKPNAFQAKFALDIPSWLGYRLDQVLIQNNGIHPHILIRPQDSIVGNRDYVLERAVQVHRDGYIADEEKYI